MTRHENTYLRLWEQFKSFLSLNIENARLTAAEKVTVLLTTAALAVVALLVGIIVLFFISIALANLLALAVGSFWSYMIIAGAYLLLLALLIVLRKPLVINPVSRFITRLFLS